MDERFVNVGAAEDKVIEECAEVVQAICKIKRFGIFNFHPDRPDSSNRDEALAEIADLRRSLDAYETELRETPPEVVAGA